MGWDQGEQQLQDFFLCFLSRLNTVQGICKPCRGLLAADKAFDCNQGPRSANWICQTCHDNGDESVVDERVIKLSGCSFPTQAKHISKSEKEAWRLFASISPKNARRSSGGHLAAARERLAQRHEPTEFPAIMKSIEEAPKKSLKVVLKLGQPKKAGPPARSDASLFPNLARNNQDWSITPNRPPTPPESSAGGSAKASPVKSNFAPPPKLPAQSQDRLAAISRQPGQVSDMHDNQTALGEADDGLSIISSHQKKRKRLYRGLKHRALSPGETVSRGDDRLTKGWTLDSSFQSNEDLLEKWTISAQRRASGDTNATLDAPMLKANRSSPTIKSDHQVAEYSFGLDGAEASRPMREPSVELLDALLADPHAELSEDLLMTMGRTPIQAGKNPIDKDSMDIDEPSSKAIKLSSKDPEMDIDPAKQEEPLAEANPSIPDQQAMKAEERSLDRQEMLHQSNSEQSQLEELQVAKSQIERPGGARPEAAHTHVTPEPMSTMGRLRRTFAVEYDPIYNGNDAKVLESLSEAAAQNFSVHSWSDRTSVPWETWSPSTSYQPRSDHRSMTQDISSPETTQYLRHFEMSETKKPAEIFPKGSSKDSEKGFAADIEQLQQATAARTATTTCEQRPTLSTSVDAEHIGPTATEAQKTSAASASRSPKLLTQDSTSQADSTHHALTGAAVSRSQPQNTPRDYIDDMLAAARATKEASPVTAPSYSIQWSPVNAPGSSQNSTEPSRRTQSGPAPATERKPKARSRAPKSKPLPKLAPTPSPFTSSEDRHQRGKYYLSRPDAMVSIPPTPTAAVATLATNTQPFRQIALGPAPEIIDLESSRYHHLGHGLQPSTDNGASDSARGVRTSSIHDQSSVAEQRGSISSMGNRPNYGAAGAIEDHKIGSAPQQAPPTYPFLTHPRTTSVSGPVRSSNLSSEAYERPNLAPASMAGMDTNIQRPKGSGSFDHNGLPSLEHTEIFTRNLRQLPSPYPRATATASGNMAQLDHMSPSRPAPMDFRYNQMHQVPSYRRIEPFVSPAPAINSLPRSPAVLPTRPIRALAPQGQQLSREHLPKDGYSDEVRRHLEQTKLRICVNNSSDTEILRLGGCQNQQEFINKILSFAAVHPRAVEKFRITFDWMPEGTKGRSFIMKLSDQEDGFGHINDEIHGKFMRFGFSVTMIDVDILLKEQHMAA